MRAVLLSLAVVVGPGLGCSDSRHIREWRASDHDVPEELQNQPEADPGGQASSAEEATEMIWVRECVRCHGRDGSGRSPMAARIPVKDLRRSTLAEAEVVQVVSGGRREMPAFAQKLGPEAIRALARKVMTFRR